MDSPRCSFCHNEVWVLRAADIPVLEGKPVNGVIAFVCRECAKKNRDKLKGDSK